MFCILFKKSLLIPNVARSLTSFINILDYKSKNYSL